MKHHDEQFTIEEVESLCLLFQDCKLSVLEETELEYVLMHINYNSPLIEETKVLMALSRSVNIVEAKKSHKPIWTWVMRTAACFAILLGALFIYRYSTQINFITGSNDCIVYVAGERANDKVALEIAEADVAKMQRFMQTVNEQKASEQAKVEQFMNHINQKK